MIMKQRKIIAIITSLLVVMSSTFLSSGSINQELIAAKNMANILFSQDEKGKIIRAEFLKGLDNNEDYIIVSCENGGYAIFDRENIELIEYSLDNPTPYQNIKNESCYYGGPTNYYQKKGNKVVHLYNGEDISDTDMTEISNDVKRLIKRGKEKRKKDKNEQIETQGDKETEKVETPDPGTTGESTQQADSFNYKSRRFIENSKYFLSAPNHGSNTTGTCMTVASQLLLSYNNWANDGRIVQEVFEGEQFYYNNRQENVNNIYHNSMISTTSGEDNSNIVTFYECLLGYIDSEENGANLDDAYRGIWGYLMDHTSTAVQNEIHIESFYDDERSYDDLARNIVKSEIQNNRPAILCAYHYRKNGNTYTVGRHAMVAYGYQTVVMNGEEIDGFIVHYGWGAAYTSVWVDSNWAYGYLTFKTGHQHNDEVLPTNIHIVHCKICDRYAKKEAHTYSQYKLSNNIADEMYHIAVCSCGYEQQEQHTMKYVRYDSRYHDVVCKYCDYGYKETHFFKGSNDVCWYCVGA